MRRAVREPRLSDAVRVQRRRERRARRDGLVRKRRVARVRPEPAPPEPVLFARARPPHAILGQPSGLGGGKIDFMFIFLI